MTFNDNSDADRIDPSPLNAEGDMTESSSQTLSTSKVTVRLAQNQDDIEAMKAMGQTLHDESIYKTLPLDDGRMQEIGDKGLKEGNPGLLIAEKNGEAVGMAIVVLGEYYFAPVRSATVQLFYVIPEARGTWAAIKLLRALRQWAKRNEAQDLHINVTTAIDTARTDRFLRTMGFKQTGGNYVVGVAK